MVEVSLLGSVGVVVDGERRSIGSAAQRAVLAALAVRPGEVVSADRLAEAIWGEAAPRSATAGLQVYVSRLRKVVGSQSLLSDAGGYVLVGATTDVAVFERLARAGDAAALDAALDMWRGEPFGDLADRDMFRLEVLRLHQLRAAAEERRVELALVDDPRWAVAAAEALCLDEPLHENRWILLARARAASGQTAAALRALSEARAALAEVGLEPSPVLTELEDQLLSAQSPPAVKQAGVAIPALAVPMIGRKVELEDLGHRMMSHRIVTLVGPGGVGKTFLARAYAQRPGIGAASWCDLASDETGSAVVATLARAVGASMAGSIEETLLEALRPRSVLLVLDNCEHVVGEVARVVSAIVAACPDVRLLATSRVPLAVAAEWVMPVQPLDPDRDGHDLFVDRALAAGTPPDALDPSAVRRLCQLLDGLPLAIAMAATRTRSLGLVELERRLESSVGVLDAPSRGVPPRHRTLANMVNWSIDLLQPEERLALARASAFSASFSLQAAEAVIGTDPISPEDVAGLLGALVDESLVVAQHLARGIRYRMLYTVRRVVRQAIGPEEATAADRRHGSYYASLAVALEPDFFGPKEAIATVRALDETTEFRTAVLNSLEADQEVAIQICASLFPVVYNSLRADIAEWGERVFAVVEPIAHPLIPTVGAMAALAAIQRGDLPAALDLCDRARSAATTEADLAQVMLVEGDVAAYVGSVDDTEARGDEMRTIARQAGNATWEVFAVVAISLGRLYGGDRHGATEAAAEARRVASGIGSSILTAWLDYLEGEVLLDIDPERAGPYLERALQGAGDTGNLFVEGVAGLSLASLQARHGDAEQARAQFAETIRHWLEVGDWIHQWVTLRNVAPLLYRLGDPEGAAMLLAAVDRRQRHSYGEEAERLDRLRREVQQQLPAHHYDELEFQSSRLSDREVVELALSRLESARPAHQGH